MRIIYSFENHRHLSLCNPFHLSLMQPFSKCVCLPPLPVLNVQKYWLSCMEGSHLSTISSFKHSSQKLCNITAPFPQKLWECIGVLLTEHYT